MIRRGKEVLARLLRKDAIEDKATVIEVSSWAAQTRRGPRMVSQDRFGADGRLFCIADGIGGFKHGDRSAAAAVRALHSAHPKDKDSLSTALMAADHAVRAVGRSRQSPVGTTLAALLVTEEDLSVVAAGDSRVYYSVDGGDLQVVTVDDTAASAFSMAVTAPGYRAANRLLTAHLGSDTVLRRSAKSLCRFQRSARAILTTDGVHNSIPARRLAALGLLNTPDAAALALIEAAYLAGSHDDATVVVVDIERARFR